MYYLFVYIYYFIGKFSDTGSGGAVERVCSKAFRNTNEIYLEHARKGFGVRTKRLRNKRVCYEVHFCILFLMCLPHQCLHNAHP